MSQCDLGQLVDRAFPEAGTGSQFCHHNKAFVITG